MLECIVRVAATDILPREGSIGRLTSVVELKTLRDGFDSFVRMDSGPL